ncbi:hypothetical protein FE840_019290 (plasmid) [Peteryoungia desertarenae]|uniref:DUF1772 domain-containing protein n=1 Tax=Peteryoungia desertarenae TaxID=1813451 RepID=A0ABX6QU01_9HYPH|nr:hypothetical protein [Peteryoungia desertarenae]QLF71767.1 hypothetical protein FE840_019290 [Peteryoungia desertarenae]
MDRNAAFGVLAGLAGTVGVVGLIVFTFIHLGITLGMTDISHCGVKPNFYPLVNLLWPFIAGLVFVILSAIFDETAVPVAIIGALAVAGFFFAVEIWFVVESFSAQQTAEEMRRGYGGAMELKRQLFHDSGFWRFMDAIF